MVSIGTFAVTVPEMGWLAGKLETETTLPLTALVILAIAVEPRDTTVWAGVCSPPERMVERVVADWLPSKIGSAIF